MDLVLLIMIYILVRYEMRGRLRAEKRLEQKSDILRLVQNNMADGVMAVDMEGRFIVLNPAAEKFLGFKLENIPALNSWSEKMGFFNQDSPNPLVYSERS